MCGKATGRATPSTGLRTPACDFPQRRQSGVEKGGLCGTGVKSPASAASTPRASRAVCSIASAGAENTAPNQNKTREVFHLLPGRVWKISRVLFPALTSQNPGTSGWAEYRYCSGICRSGRAHIRRQCHGNRSGRSGHPDRCGWAGHRRSPASSSPQNRHHQIPL